MIINTHSLAPWTQQTLASATGLAAKHRRQFTATEHVVMALCTDPEFVALVGNHIEFDPDMIHAAIEGYMRPEDEDQLAGNALRMTPRLTHVLDIAAKIAQEMGAPAMEPMHVLLGILKEGQSVTAQVLNAHGIFFAQLIAAINNEATRELVDAAVGPQRF